MLLSICYQDFPANPDLDREVEGLVNALGGAVDLSEVSVSLVHRQSDVRPYFVSLEGASAAGCFDVEAVDLTPTRAVRRAVAFLERDMRLRTLRSERELAMSGIRRGGAMIVA